EGTLPLRSKARARHRRHSTRRRVHGRKRRRSPKRKGQTRTGTPALRSNPWKTREDEHSGKRRNPIRGRLLMDSETLRFVPAQPSEVDAKLVMRWRNDPDTLAMS